MRRGISLLLFVLFVASPGETQDSARRDIEGRLLALERVGKLQASELKDLKMLTEILDGNFVSVDQDGLLMNKTQVLAYVQNATSLRYVTSEMTVRLHGSTAIVTGLYQLTEVIAGKTVIRRGRLVDTWIEKEGKWVTIASLSTPLT